MPNYTGTIENIVVTDQFCCLRIKVSPTSVAYVLLWSFYVSTPSASLRLIQSQWLNIARDAFLNAKTVTAYTPSSGSLVTQLSIY